MGIFSGRTKTYVSSTLYSLAGDPGSRSSFKQLLSTSYVVGTNKDASYGELLTQSLMKGPGRKQLQFFKWAQEHYALGLPQARIGGTSSVASDVLQAPMESILGLTPGQVLRINSADIGNTDFDVWANAWVLSAYPGALVDEWIAEWQLGDATIKVDVTGIDPMAPVHEIPTPADLVWSAGDPNNQLLSVLYQVGSTSPEGIVSFGRYQLMTYRMGSGVAPLDELQLSSSEMLQFYPAMPLRIDNKSIRDPALVAMLPAVSKGYKKLTGTSVNTLLDSIEDMDQIGDIDYCFLVQGVPLNTRDQADMSYLYRFFQNLIPAQKTTKEAFEVYASFREDVLTGNASFEDWLSFSGLAADMPSVVQAVSGPTLSKLQMFMSSLTSFNQEMIWAYVAEESFEGNAKSYDGDFSRGALPVGSYWIHNAEDLVLVEQPSGAASAFGGQNVFGRFYVFKQVSEGVFSRVEVVGLEHLNYVYAGKTVRTGSKEALDLADDTSALLIPLHYPTLKQIGIMRGTQVGGASSYLVFNCVVEKKQKWWQTGFFKVLIFVAIVTLSVVLPPAGAGLASAGILGSNLALGTAMGFTTAMTAAIAGALANAVAGLILSSLIQAGSKAIFGDEAGAVIGAIVSFVAMSAATSYMTTGEMNMDWGSMMQADNLSELTSSVGSAYGAWSQSNVSNRLDQLGKLQTAYEGDISRIAAKAEALFGETAEGFDPMMMADDYESDYAPGFEAESPEAFQERTTMTGDDIVELSQSMIDDFVEMSTSLPDMG